MAARSPLLLSLVLVGCARAGSAPAAAPGDFLRASPIVEHVPAEHDTPEHVDLESGAVGEKSHDSAGEGDLFLSTSLPGEPASPVVRRRAPAPSATLERPPSAIIQEANAQASQGPDPAGFLNAVMTYAFVPGGVYLVYTAPDNLTDLVLEPGEEILGTPAAGDVLRWRLDVGTSAVAGVSQKHVFLKPTRAGLSTNLTITTNRRTYFVRLQSLETAAMVAVQWHYSDQESRPLPAASAREPNLPARSPADVSELHWNYSVEVESGHPAWKPKAIFDDGQKTYLRFDRSLLHGEAPVLYVVEHDEPQLVNYRVKNDLYIVDRLFHVAELRLGQKDQDVMRITRH